MASLDTLPPPVLDRLLRAIFNADPELQIAFLSSFGRQIHLASSRVIFSKVVIPDDNRYFSTPSSALLSPGPISAIMRNPHRYSPFVMEVHLTNPLVITPRRRTIRNHCFTSNPVLDCADRLDSCSEDDSSDDARAKPLTPIEVGSKPAPISSDNLTSLLAFCKQMEVFQWSSVFSPPDGLCEVLSSNHPRLHTFGVSLPADRDYGSNPQVPFAKWDAPSLVHLQFHSLARLALTRLTQQGARALTLLLAGLGEESVLEDAYFDFLWLDDALCGKIVLGGRRLKRLTLGTPGTKLTDKGILDILEGCQALEDLGLINVQGRLTKNLWTNVKAETLPAAFHTLRIAISETGPHHSWSLDHLQSLPNFPIESLSRISVTRCGGGAIGLGLDSGVSRDGARVVLEETVTLKAVPREMLRSIVMNGKNLQSLDCDWWSWAPEDLKPLLEYCRVLKDIKLCFNAPFCKILNLATTIAAAPCLRTLWVSIPAEHSPSPPPSPFISTPKSSLSPANSPMLSLKSALTPTKGGFSAPVDPLVGGATKDLQAYPISPTISTFPSFSSSSSKSVFDTAADSVSNIELPSAVLLDAGLPPLRDIKRFFKRCSNMHVIGWNDRAAWALEPSSGGPARSTSVIMIPPTSLDGLSNGFGTPDGAPCGLLTPHDLIGTGKCEWDTNLTREGQDWVGDAAELTLRKLANLDLAEKNLRAKDTRDGTLNRSTEPRQPQSTSHSTTPGAQKPDNGQPASRFQGPSGGHSGRKHEGASRTPSNKSTHGPSVGRNPLSSGRPHHSNNNKTGPNPPGTRSKGLEGGKNARHRRRAPSEYTQPSHGRPAKDSGIPKPPGGRRASDMGDTSGKQTAQGYSGTPSVGSEVWSTVKEGRGRGVPLRKATV